MNNKRTVMLVDDHPMFRKGVRNIISESSKFRVIAEAGNGKSALTLARVHMPEIVVVDLALPDVNGLTLIGKILKLPICTEVVVLSLYNDTELIDCALAMGAKGYLMKSDGADILLQCLEHLDQNIPFLSPSVGLMYPDKPVPFELNSHWQALLSPRELTVMCRIAMNYTSKEIALELGLSARTVQNHRARIMKKLELQGRNSLYRFAVDHRAVLSDV